MTKNSLEHNGYAVHRQLVDSSTLAKILRECRGRVARIGRGYSKDSVRDVNAWLASPNIREFIFSGLISDTLTEYTGQPAWRLYHTESIFKRPGDGEIGWHQDQLFCPVDAEMLTVWIALSDIQSGRLQYVRESHNFGEIQPEMKTDFSPQRPSQAHIQSLISGADLKIDTPDLCAGDAVIHTGCTLHRSEENISTTTREALVIFAFPAGAKIRSRLSLLQWSQMKYFPGLLPGHAANSVLNPHLYHESQETVLLSGHVESAQSVAERMSPAKSS